MRTRELIARFFRALSSAAVPVALVLATCVSTPGVSATPPKPACRFRFTPRTERTPLEAIQLLSSTLVFGSDRECLYVSKNGGRAFRKVRCAPFAPEVKDRLSRFHFSSRTAGWAVTNDGTLLRTKDGGANWEALPYPNHVVRDVHFADARSGFWVGERISGDVPDVSPVAFATRDGGQTWSEVPLLGPVTERARLEGVWMRSPSEVWVVGDQMLTSTNSGQTWQPMSISPDVAAELRNTSIRFGQRGVGWVLRQPVESYLLTCDGGRTWASRSPPEPGLNTLFHVDCMRAYAAASGSIYRSDDGGQSFHVTLEADAETPGYTALSYLKEEGLLLALSERTVATCRLAAP